jgi:translation initiation factor IF-1
VDFDLTRGAGPGPKVVAGVVSEQLPSALYRVKLEEGGLITAHIAGRIDRNFLRVLVGDRVRIELSPIDAGRGRIVEKIPG